MYVLIAFVMLNLLMFSLVHVFVYMHLYVFSSYKSKNWKNLAEDFARFFFFYVFILNLKKSEYIYGGCIQCFQTFFVWAFKIVVDSWKITVIAIHLMRWLTNFYDFKFKWTATAGIGMHPSKAWLSQLVNFKNAIWHFRRTICYKILF